VYDPKETPQFVERVDLEAGLRSALANREFVLHYQPIIDPTSLQIAGFEALIRWQHPVRGLFAPSEFIWLAEDTGLIEPIGQWVLDQACTTLAVWRQELDCPALKMSINVSAVQLHQPGFAALVAAVTRDHGLPPSSLILEVTERVLVRPEQTVEALEELRALGVAIALDDFGTGYSSLSYLRRLPLDYIKVDRSFIQDICGETGDSSIVRAITGLAASLGLAVIAEGVETEAQAAVVVSLGCELAQGYLYGKPQTQAAAESLIAQRNRQPVRPVSRGAR
jgi:EAL domain-containing protein (putative c-di-GMP-specific phosphodiesterase class I)